MRESDRQLGKPLRAYVGSQAAIEALSLVALDEGCVGYASDIDAHGVFDGSSWAWAAVKESAIEPAIPFAGLFWVDTS